MNSGVPLRIFSQGFMLVIWVLAAVVFSSLGCERGVPTAPLAPQYSVNGLNRIPVILVGEVLEESHATALPTRSEWNGRLVQLWQVRTRVEQVLQGELPEKEITIFYFADMDGGESSIAWVSRLYPGRSEMFFLQKDRRVWRTICDGWETCIMWVRTGTHYNFKPGQSFRIEDAVVKLFLSRGDHTTDAQILDAVYHPPLRWGTIPVLEALKDLSERDRAPAVRSLAAKRWQRLRSHQRPYRTVPPGCFEYDDQPYFLKRE